MKRTSHNYMTYQEEKAAIQDYKEFLHNDKNLKHLGASLLDSSLNITTKNKKYYIKVVDCGSYKQFYYYNDLKIVSDNDLEPERKIDHNYLFKKENIKTKKDLKKIEYKNLMRSVFNCQRIIKANEKEFKTFITLTFDSDVKDITTANKRFRYFRDSLQRVYKNLKYICVPEFTKNDRVHYHLLTNIDYSSDLLNENLEIEKIRNKKYKLYKNKIISSNIKDYKMNDFKVCLRYQNNKLENTKKTYNYKSKKTKIFKTIRYWNNGFSNVVFLQDLNLVGYLTKYLTKDIDNRLFGKNRYLSSKNLIIPREYYIDCNRDEDFYYIIDILNNSDIIYQKTYLDLRENEINFIEYKIK